MNESAPLGYALLVQELNLAGAPVNRWLTSGTVRSDRPRHAMSLEEAFSVASASGSEVVIAVPWSTACAMAEGPPVQVRDRFVLRVVEAVPVPKPVAEDL